MPIEELPIFCYFNRQRFQQFGSMDAANWYGIQVPDSKKGQALYPAMGRKHISFGGQNRLVFDQQPRKIFKSIDYFYVVEGQTVYQFNKFYNRRVVTLNGISLAGRIWVDFLAVSQVIYILMSDETNLYVIVENDPTPGMPPVYMKQITDPHAPGGSVAGGSPQFVAAFGNRFVVSKKNTPELYLSQINLGGVPLDPATCFTNPVTGVLFAQASGIVRQFGVLHGQLYIFNDYSTDIWGNISTQLNVGGTVTTFPWKLNTSYNFDYGMADPLSLSTDFGRMAWLAKNESGIVTFMVTEGQRPDDMDTQAINVLLEATASIDELNPFLSGNTDAFLYQYENTIFYRAVAGRFLDFGELDIEDSANAIEYNFDTKTWARVIELNGERNRIQSHIYFNNKHLVTVEDDGAMYEMAGNIYHNELRTPGKFANAPDAFTKYPMRYELVTRQLFLPDYSEFIDDYVEIDFVFGNKTFYRDNAPYLNTVYLTDESSTPQVPVYLISEQGEYLVQDGTNIPTFDDNHYYALFKPHLELYYSDDGGVTFFSADLREFSPLGVYRWRMRWYELASSRNRCYRLVCVSSSPIVILGAVRNTRRISGGAN